MSSSITFQAGIRDKFEVVKGIEPTELCIDLQQDVQNSADLTTQVRKHQPIRGVERFLKKCVHHGKGMHPRKFCRRWFGMEDLNTYGRSHYTEPQILAIESEYGYREKCINLIARVLKIKPNTVQRWGKGVEFDKIPLNKREEYEMYLGYVDTIRVITLSVARFDEDFLLELSHCLDFH
jgi:hypothetical protein